MLYYHDAVLTIILAKNNLKYYKNVRLKNHINSFESFHNRLKQGVLMRIQFSQEGNWVQCFASIYVLVSCSQYTNNFLVSVPIEPGCGLCKIFASAPVPFLLD